LQVNYNRKKDLEFIINSWSFFFGGLFFFHSLFLCVRNYFKAQTVIIKNEEELYGTEV